MIDPALLWAMTPGQGRAPLVAEAPAPVTQDPKADLARLLLGGSEDNRTLAGDMPIGALMRDIQGMSPQERFSEYEAKGGLDPSLGQKALTSAPATILGALAGPLVGTVGAAAARKSTAERQRNLSRAMMGERQEGRAAYAMGQKQARDAFNRSQEAQDRNVRMQPGGTKIFIGTDIYPQGQGGNSDYSGRGGAGDTWTGPGGVFV